MTDASRTMKLAQDNQLGSLIKTQIQAADILLISKTDLVSSDELTRLRAWSREHYLNIAVVKAVDGQLPDQNQNPLPNFQLAFIGLAGQLFA